MDLRYLGFEQQRNCRVYRFDAKENGHPAQQFTVTAELALFLTYHVNIQDGPALSASKLASDLERQFTGAHELTADDLRLYCDARTRANEERAARKPSRRRPPAPKTQPDGRATWRNFSV
jgi:hypothetical protein